MKKFIIYGLCFVVLSFFGCSSKPENPSSTAPAVEQQVEDTSNTGLVDPNTAINSETQAVTE